jgi:ElaB/YqjD/DUF883 family membrane-anchored ribosome-binding protein
MNANQPIEEGSVLHAVGGGARKRPARSARRLRADGRAVPERDALDGPGERIADLAAAVARSIRSRPMHSIAVALGVGFVVGGALSFRAGRIVLGAAARHVAREFLKQVL